MDKIIIKDLKTSCLIGLKPEERQNKQEIIIDLYLRLDLSKAAETDSIEDTIDYDELSDQIADFVEKSDFKLLEKLALKVAKLAKRLSGAEEVKIIVKKPAAIKKARFAAVELSI